MDRSSQDDKKHFLKREQPVKRYGMVMKQPGYLGNGEKFDVAEIHSRWNGGAVGDEI